MSDLRQLSINLLEALSAMTPVFKAANELQAALEAELKPPVNRLDSFIPYSQNDPRWAADHLGYLDAANDSKIGKYGCAITAIANLLKWFSYPETPADVEIDLRQAGAFRTDGTRNLIDGLKIPLVYPMLSGYDRRDFGSRDPNDSEMAALHETLKSTPVILKVDAIPETAPLDEHFVLALAVNEQGKIVIADSWDGRIKLLSTYAPLIWPGDKDKKAIYAMIRYTVTP